MQLFRVEKRQQQETPKIKGFLVDAGNHLASRCRQGPAIYFLLLVFRGMDSPFLFEDICEIIRGTPPYPLAGDAENCKTVYIYAAVNNFPKIFNPHIPPSYSAPDGAGRHR